MDFKICLLLLVVLCLENGETGGHGGKHHDHVNVHVPEFIHHDHHTKVITIHHHHHKPKKEHHHHHHHHQKPYIPHGHHYHHKKAHTTLKTETTKHGHGHGHGHHGHHGHHHKSHGHHHHHDAPSYDPPRIPAYEDEYASYNPPAPSYPSIGHQSPRVHGVTHTVKQVKVFDSLPGVIPNAGNHGNPGYEVTENGDDEEEDVFTSVNGLQQSYPATYGYLRGAAEQPTHDPFAELTPQGAAQTNNHDPFAGAIPQPAVILSDGHNFQGNHHDPFAASNPTENTGLIIQPSDFPAGFDGNSGIDQPTSFVGTGGDNSVYLANEENSISDGPVSFSREAGIQHTTKTGGVETLLY